MNLQQELALERKEKQELLDRVSLLEEQVKSLENKLTDSRIIIFNRIVQLENITRKLC